MSDQQTAKTYISAEKIVLSYGSDILLKPSELTVNEGDRIAVIGRNGSGKSTLLKALAGLSSPSEGCISQRKELKTAYLPQEIIIDQDKNIQEVVLEGVSSILNELSRISDESVSEEEKARIITLADNNDYWNLEQKAERLLADFKFTDFNRHVRNLSGGEKRRIAICRCLITRPDIIFLDEPTNHLDIENINCLEEVLRKENITIVFISHDRQFIDNIANRIIEIDRQQLHSYLGDYDEYLLLRYERLENLRALEGQRQRFLRKEIEWIRRKPKARTTKAKGRVDKFFEKLNADGFREDQTSQVIIPPPPRLGGRVLDLRKISLRYDQQLLIDTFEYSFQAGKITGVLGPSGCGKTSLIRLLLGKIIPNEGTIIPGDMTVFNYIDQEREELDPDKTPLEIISADSEWVEFGGTRISSRAYLKKYLFSDEDLNMQIKAFSGGEKNRLLLAMKMKKGGNFLIFDEPTNDLDLATLSVLEEALLSYNGVALIVSHDRFFLNRVADEMFVFNGNGRIEIYHGNYDYYLLKSEQMKLKDITPAVKKPQQLREKIKSLSWKEKEELKNMEKDIAKAEEEVLQYENLFSSSDFYEKNSDNLSELNTDFNKARERVDFLYHRWEELEEKQRLYIQGCKN